MRRWIAGAAIIVLAGVVLVLATGPILSHLSRRMINRMIERPLSASLRLDSVRFDRLALDPTAGLVYRGVRGRLAFRGDNGFRAGRVVAVEVDRSVVRLVGLVPLKVAVDVDGLSAVATPVGTGSGEQLAAAEVLTSGRGRFVLSGPSGSPIEWVRAALGDMLRSVIQGEMTDGSRFSGRVEFSVGSQWHSALLYTLVSRGGTRLVLNRDDVAQIGAQYKQPLTEAEIDLVSLYPLRTPVLLRIKQYAANESFRMSRSIPSLSADAYRHVLWSYLLTREFGEEFAEQVTDAHEIGATYESGQASREMDLANNAVGRRYFLEGVREVELPQKVLTDPTVVRGPGVLVF
ncbi:MAG: hypothetical protein R3F07_10225 [Opitutaceae bacterium]